MNERTDDPKKFEDFGHRSCDQPAGSVDEARAENLPATSCAPPLDDPHPSHLSKPEAPPLIELEPRQMHAIAGAVPGGMANVQDIYPLTPLQEGMLFHHLLNERDETYVLSTVFELQSPAHVGSLIAAVQAIVDRYEILRSAILWEGLPRPLHVVYRKVALCAKEILLDPLGDPATRLRELSQPPYEKWNLQRAPLLELYVTRDSRHSRRYAILNIHHIICDHQSLRVITAELKAYACRQGDQLPPAASYRDYVAQLLARARPDAAEVFFRRKLADVDSSTAPFGLCNVHRDGSAIEEAQQLLDTVVAQRLRTQVRQLGLSAARLCHAAWALVVALTSGRDDIVYGTVLSVARSRSVGAERIVGVSVNTLPLRLKLKGLSVSELLRQTDDELRELLNHVATPLPLAQRCSGVEAAAPLFTSLLNFRHGAAEGEDDSSDASGIRVLKRGEAWTNYPITLTVDDCADRFVLMAKADRSIGANRTIDHFTTALESLVEALECRSEALALSLQVVPAAELRLITQQFNATDVPWPQESLLHQLFEEQVKTAAAAVAVTDEQRSLTYDELNRKANQLARYLRRRGVGPDRLVAICLERSVDMLIGMLGILKAGGAYVPLDPANPFGRLKHLLDDSQPDVLLTHRMLGNRLPQTEAAIVALDTSWQAIAAEDDCDIDARAVGLSASHLAYVIYTSGSTGTPKGVMVEHRNIVNYSVHARRQFDVDHGNGSLICTSFSFDLMLTGLYPTLLGGRTVRLCREERGIPALAEQLLNCQGLSPLKLTPSHLTLVEGLVRRGQADGCVRTLVLGGESLRSAAVRRWKTHAPGTRIFNHYGPTETTVGCLVHEIEDMDADCDVLPVGRPISNVRAYVLDEHLRAVSIGVVGQIYIGGAGVARGYLNRPELTAERFIANPFSADQHSRMYKTGDLGRWRPDGTIEYLGRNDQQVKIRGFRIETAEIEAQLMRQEYVQDVAVIAREDAPGEKRLVAYVVPSATGTPSVESLRARLKDELPEYMVPSAFMLLERLPLTPNGKMDRRALPLPAPQSCPRRQYEAPQGDVEQILAEIWQALLRVDRVGRHDNFFELGGHSLHGMRLIETIEQRLQGRLSVAAIFSFPTIESMAEALDGTRPTRSVPTGHMNADFEEGVV